MGVLYISLYFFRFYRLVLDREPDLNGYNGWVAQLVSGDLTADNIALGFFTSPEFTNRWVDDSTFVDICYRAFFNREFDAGGKAYWLDVLGSGYSRDYVVNSFIGSTEFAQLAESFGIRVR